MGCSKNKSSLKIQEKKTIVKKILKQGKKTVLWNYEALGRTY